MNRVLLTGRLTKDPEVSTYRKGKEKGTVAKYILAVQRTNDDADFIMITAFDKLADFASDYLKKGMKILVEGHFQTSEWDDKDGNRHWRQDVIVDRHEFCEKKDK